VRYGVPQRRNVSGGPLRVDPVPSTSRSGVRVLSDFTLRERWRLKLIGDVFNLFNFANLSGPSGDLLGAGFGQPTSRVTQVFGSGGPRAFQIAARVSF
jgi:hypothetical protein